MEETLKGIKEEMKKHYRAGNQSEFVKAQSKLGKIGLSYPEVAHITFEVIDELQEEADHQPPMFRTACDWK